MMIRGEPAIGHELSRANYACIRLNPYRAPTMKRSYASTGKAPEAVGSILPDMLATYGLDKPKNSANPLRLCTNFVHTLGRAVCFGEARGNRGLVRDVSAALLPGDLLDTDDTEIAGARHQPDTEAP